MEKRAAYIKSSEICVVTEATMLRTVVGSCVAVCMFDREKKIAGMNHFLLPRLLAGADKSQKGKFGDLAIPELLRQMKRRGAEPENIVAKIAGGASVLSISSHNHVPLENVKSARTALNKLGICIVSQDVGGSKGRKVEFDTATGHVTINGSRLL